MLGELSSFDVNTFIIAHPFLASVIMLFAIVIGTGFITQLFMWHWRYMDRDRSR